MFGLFNTLRACSVRVAASGVKFDVGRSICLLRRCAERSREAETHVQKVSKFMCKKMFLKRYVCQHCVALETCKRIPFLCMFGT